MKTVGSDRGGGGAGMGSVVPSGRVTRWGTADCSISAGQYVPKVVAGPGRVRP